MSTILPSSICATYCTLSIYYTTWWCSYGHSLANIKAATFDYNMSIEILVIVVLGGMGSVPGAEL